MPYLRVSERLRPHCTQLYTTVHTVHTVHRSAALCTTVHAVHHCTPLYTTPSHRPTTQLVVGTTGGARVHHCALSCCHSQQGGVRGVSADVVTW